jgi:hypothetical protein
VREAVSRQLSARRFEPWGWSDGWQSQDAHQQVDLVPTSDDGVFASPWGY